MYIRNIARPVDRPAAALATPPRVSQPGLSLFRAACPCAPPSGTHDCTVQIKTVARATAASSSSSQTGASGGNSGQPALPLGATARVPGLSRRAAAVMVQQTEAAGSYTRSSGPCSSVSGPFGSSGSTGFLASAGAGLERQPGVNSAGCWRLHSWGGAVRLLARLHPHNPGQHSRACLGWGWKPALLSSSHMWLSQLPCLLTCERLLPRTPACAHLACSARSFPPTTTLAPAGHATQRHRR